MRNPSGSGQILRNHEDGIIDVVGNPDIACLLRGRERHNAARELFRIEKKFRKKFRKNLAFKSVYQREKKKHVI